eukprot:contig_12636_g3021
MREARRAHLRDRAFKVRNNLELAQKRYKKSYDCRFNPVNETLKAGDLVYVDTHDKERKNLDQLVEGPYRILRRDGHTFTVMAK